MKSRNSGFREPVDAATRLSFLCSNYSFHRDGGPSQVAGLGGGWGEQRHHFRDRTANRPMGIRPCKRVLHRALPLQHTEVALAWRKQR